MAAAASLGKMPPWKMSSFSTSRKMENFCQCPTSMIVCKMKCRQRYWWFLTTDGETLANWQNLNGFCMFLLADYFGGPFWQTAQKVRQTFTVDVPKTTSATQTDVEVAEALLVKGPRLVG